ncbi:MAG: hypothetical protein LBI80_03025 [Endomicrobium sp.]|jgi:hypothetical protein|nr:hypothetical protein [Endomicrobium sp.]
MNKKIIFIFPVFIIFLASIFASKYPDTLERLAINYEFIDKTKESLSIFSNYSFPFVKNSIMNPKNKAERRIK